MWTCIIDILPFIHKCVNLSYLNFPDRIYNFFGFGGCDKNMVSRMEGLLQTFRAQVWVASGDRYYHPYYPATLYVWIYLLSGKNFDHWSTCYLCREKMAFSTLYWYFFYSRTKKSKLLFFQTISNLKLLSLYFHNFCITLTTLKFGFKK